MNMQLAQNAYARPEAPSRTPRDIEYDLRNDLFSHLMYPSVFADFALLRKIRAQKIVDFCRRNTGEDKHIDKNG